MRIRVNFEYGAGVCMWADDAEARARWTSAVEFADVGLPAALREEGQALQVALERHYFENDCVFEARWSDAERAAFHARAAEWVGRVGQELAAAGIEVAPYGADPTPGDPILDGKEFEGCVLACFADEAARAAADRAESADSGWAEVAVWNGDTLKLRETERSPAELLAKLEAAPGFVAGWWQASHDEGSAMLEGDPQEHALDCLRTRNATGFAHFLSWLRMQRVHLSADLAGEAWSPTRQHRLADTKGSWWEWFQFVRNAGAALKGGKVSARYLRAERERLWWKWTHGGSRAGWPATFGEAFERTGLKREAFNRWAR
ncbi:MAG: hypothetical protein QG602_393 [Verrucomicrobiota bacterium]|nr:hypothetical protein [Verrucomicrobiota bacterium]